MKVLLHYPNWKNRWEEHILKALSGFDVAKTDTTNVEELRELSKDKDVLISMWCSSVVNFWSHEFPEKKIITYLRRFELWEPEFMIGPNWDAVDYMIFVSDWVKKAFNLMCEQSGVTTTPKKQVVIPNGIDIDSFPLRKEKSNTNKIAIVGSLKEVKNFPLAIQILTELPPKYEMYHVGIQFNSQNTGILMSYAYNLGINNRIHFEGFIPKENMYKWYLDKDYLLSSATNEGNPNCIIEAMCMGIKPIIHNFPGSTSQFPPDLIFERIGGAIDSITGDSYNPQSYRNWVEERYSLDNFKKFREVVENVCEKQLSSV
jgi:glycosyltransferase involved in cell wall biosynthesis